jgi:cyclomaltodextrinase
MQATVPHTFIFHADRAVQSVNLAGKFNNWSATAEPMLSSDGRTWSRTVSLRPGVYQYKFVLDGKTWITDPDGKTIDDGNGHSNSLALVVPPDFALPARIGDGKIATSVISHSTAVPDFNWDRGKLTISITARPSDVERISVIVATRAYPMHVVGSDEITARYSGSIPWSRTSDLAYSFQLRDGHRVEFFGRNGITAVASTPFHVSAKTYKPFVVPTWVEKSVLYQIFPDRFANGRKENDPKDVQPWDAKPTYYNKMGGDVAGVEQHLPYLQSLGIKGIYFNPIFWSPSNHRYQAIDYYKVDPELGTNQEFSQLTHDLKRAGIRTVLDGVFNHTSTEFFAFADVVKNGEASRYKDWYTIHSFPVRTQGQPNYESFFNSPSMPKLHILNPEAEQYFLKIPQYWQTHADIAGWRLDVGNEVPMDYWRAFRKVVKKQDPQAWIVGEEWGDASPWLLGDQWDATMNYQFREAILQLVGKGHSGKPSAFMGTLMNTYASYAPQVSRNLMNLIGSHDTPRILTETGGDRDLAKLAAIIQFTWVGAPCVYYGDELGMEGGVDPDNRRGMTWARATPDNDFLSLYKKLIRLRTGSKILQSGEPEKLIADDAKGTAAFSRTLDGDSAYVALNRSDAQQTIDLPVGKPAVFREALTGASYSPNHGFIHLTLASKRAAILMPLQGNSPSHRLMGRRSSTLKGPRPLVSIVHRSTSIHV